MNNNKKKGFASMDKERMKEVASLGGRAVHAKGTGHQFTSEEAREAAKKSYASRQAKKEAEKVKQPNLGPIIVMKNPG
jgi:general stress protein YciG